MASEGLETDIINCLISGLVSVLSSSLGPCSAGNHSFLALDFPSPSVPFSFEMKPTPEGEVRYLRGL